MMKILIDIFVLQLIFLLFYQFIKNNPYFNINRWYLLGSLLISICLPLFDFAFATDWLLIDTNYFQGIFTLEEVMIDQNKISDATKISSGSNMLPNLSWPNILLSVIMMISLVKLTISAFSFYKIIRLFKKNPYQKADNGFRIYHLKNSAEAFTFLNRIMIGDRITSSQRELIIEHEKMHAKSLHSIDLVLIETVKAFMWFNPLSYIYKKEIVLNHEYEADGKTANIFNKKEYINCLLNTNFKTKELEFLNPFFNQSNLKNRITMLQSNTKSPIQKFKYLLIIPAILISFTYLSCSADQENEEEETLPFNKVDEFPYFKECGKLTDNEEKKDCTSRIITQHITKEVKKYDYKKEIRRIIKEGKKNGNKNDDGSNEKMITNYKSNDETQRIYVQFQIDENGYVKQVVARAKTPKLKKIGENVVETIPQMIPAVHNDKKVSVYLSITHCFGSRAK